MELLQVDGLKLTHGMYLSHVTHDALQALYSGLVPTFVLWPELERAYWPS